MLWSALPAGVSWGAAPELGWRVGRELLSQRSQPVTASWSGTPLAEAFSGLSRNQRVAILLDRRVDPNQPLSLILNAVPLEDAVEQIAHHCQFEVSWFGTLVYIGPRQAAARLRTLAALRAEDAARFSADRRREFSRERAWSWNDLVTPRDLCQSLADEVHARIESLDPLPHDLWAAADLPPLSWIDRLTLVANEFDLTFRFDDEGQTIRLVPIAEPVMIERRYSGGRQPAELARRFARLAPEAEVELVGGKVVVRGRVEDHDRLTARAKPPGSVKPGKDVYTMRARNQPLSAVLDKLRGQLGLKFEVDEAALEKAGVSLDQPITFGVEEATLEELLAAILKPAGLSFRGEGKVFEIVPNAECGVRSAE